MDREQPAFGDRITRDPAIMVGKPVVKGTRIPVDIVLRHLEENPDLEDLFGAFPRLTREDVRACLAFARAAVEHEQTASARRGALVARRALR